MTIVRLFLLATVAAGVGAAQTAPATPTVNSLPEVHRIYVAELVGTEAETLRELLIASLDSTRLFVLTDNADRADAVLKGAADDHAFTDTLDVQDGISTRQNGGRGSSSSSRSGSALYGGLSVSDQESHHSKERRHEAYASVRLCNRDGDVLWSTTQESGGAKFRGASADVAAKVARQLTLDMDRARRSGVTTTVVGK